MVVGLVGEGEEEGEEAVVGVEGAEGLGMKAVVVDPAVLLLLPAADPAPTNDDTGPRLFPVVGQPHPLVQFLAPRHLRLLPVAALLVLDASMQAGLTPGAYRSLYLTILGVHLAHLVAGPVGLAVLSLWTALGYVRAVRSAPVLIGAFYWSFVVAAEAAVFVTLHLSPHLG